MKSSLKHSKKKQTMSEISCWQVFSPFPRVSPASPLRRRRCSANDVKIGENHPIYEIYDMSI
jgi:hypothetical protein